MFLTGLWAILWIYSFVNFQKIFSSYFFSIFMNMYLWMGLFYRYYLVYLILKVLGMTNLQWTMSEVVKYKGSVLLMKSQCCHSFQNQTLFQVYNRFKIFIHKPLTSLWILTLFVPPFESENWTENNWAYFYRME